MFGTKRFSLEDMGAEVDKDPVLSNTIEEEEVVEPVVVEETTTVEDKDARIAELEAQVAELQAKVNALVAHEQAEGEVVLTSEGEDSNVGDDLSTEGLI